MVKISVKQVEGSWTRALNAARRTVGKAPVSKEPSDRFKHAMLMAEHSPIRLVEYDVSFEDIKQWVTVHLVRHWLGFIPFVHTQRPDRNASVTDRDSLPQGALNDMDVAVNAQAMINVSRKRLCHLASGETRKAWEGVKAEMGKADPVMARYMVKNCIYRGFCPEEHGCGYDKTDAFRGELEEYQQMRKNFRED